MSREDSDGGAARPTRRSLLGAPLAGAAVAVVAGAGRAVAAEPLEAAADDKLRPRVHDTDHVRAYYDRARG